MLGNKSIEEMAVIALKVSIVCIILICLSKC